MGFGSYDESEQEKQESDGFDEDEGINVHENTHDGDVSFESDASQDELLEKLDDMK